MCGEEFKKLQNQVEGYNHLFKVLKLSQPLLQSPADFLPVVEAIKQQVPALKNGEAVVFMGHGTSNESQRVYSNLESFLKVNGVNGFIGTLKGEPGIQTVIKKLEEMQVKEVILMPLLLATGHHVKRDMIEDKADSWKNQLEIHGFKVQIYLQGLGENPKIQQRFLDLIFHCINQ